MQQLFLQKRGKTMPYPGEILGGVYQIIDEIGKGGVGIIYRAYHLNLQKYVVVKKIKDNYVGVLEARGEVDILKSLHHSCLPQVYDFLQVNQEVYTVMDFIDGHDLKYYIDHGYRFEESTLWYWLTQLCEVLEYLHNHGILHLDIKPANIMLTAEGNIYLIDFNISLSGDGDALSGISQFYASPEQHRKWISILYGIPDQEGPLTAGTDIYSLGATFYHLMTGVMPRADLEGMIPISNYQLQYSENLVSIIDKMMRPGKNHRFHSVSKIRDTIKKMQRTKEEKMTLRIVFFGMLAGILILLITIGIIFYRNRNHVGAKEREMLAQQETRMQELYHAGEYEAAYREGIQYLNTSAEVLEKVEGAERNFLEIMVDCCMGMEAYADARSYTEELLTMAEKAEYYNNAAVASAYLGDYTDAEYYLEKARQMQGNQSEMNQTLAEIKASQGEYVEAIRIYQSLQAEEGKSSILRRIGVLALKAADTQKEYAQLAVTSYEELMGSQNAFYSDRMNLVTAYLKCGMNEKALSVLQEMEVLYPDRYELYARAAILRYNMELKKAPAEREFSKTRKAAEKAIQLYDSGSSNAADEQMETLRQLLETLPQ